MSSRKTLHYLGGIYGALNLFADAGQSDPDGDE